MNTDPDHDAGYFIPHFLVKNTRRGQRPGNRYFKSKITQILQTLARPFGGFQSQARLVIFFGPLGNGKIIQKIEDKWKQFFPPPFGRNRLSGSPLYPMRLDGFLHPMKEIFHIFRSKPNL